MIFAGQTYQILFLSNSSWAYHLIIEDLARKAAIKGVDFTSASISSKKIHQEIQESFLRTGVELDKSGQLSFDEIELFKFDLIITIGDSDPKQMIQLPAMLPHFHWEMLEFELPNEKSQIDDIVEDARRILSKHLEKIQDSELLHSMFIVRHRLRLILDNLLDGVMAHTSNRTIFFFNKAAEKITGYKRENLLGKDCHQVFPGRFCGGDCEFCDNDALMTRKIVQEKRVKFRDPDLREKILQMSTMPLSDEKGQNIGALLSFKDDTELEKLKNRLKYHHSLGRMVGKDPKTLRVFDQIKELGSVQAPILIEGESGTGKELVANAIHQISSRSKQPFVAVNCGALPEGVLESELFGHVKGAFTGAIHDKKGRFELANHGSLFLDEVAELSASMQVKLLRVLQEQSFERVGGEKTIQVDVRIISATNQNLKRMMKDRKFRRDLYYRLCVIPIHIPSLRERPLDIPVLLDHYLESVAIEIKRPVLELSNDVIDLFSSYSWPGNVRELRNAVEYVYVKCRDTVVKSDHLPPEITKSGIKPVKKPGPALKLNKEQILVALSKAKGNRKEAANILEIGRATLYRYLDHFDLQ